MLRIIIRSFSFKNGYPMTQTNHGGGYVFDCRCVPNPGRIEQFRSLTGMDEPVKEYLDHNLDAGTFYHSIQQLIFQTVACYQDRGFTELEVGFGCTGGQHRSVYFSERLAKSLQALEGVRVEVAHREFPHLKSAMIQQEGKKI